MVGENHSARGGGEDGGGGSHRRRTATCDVEVHPVDALMDLHVTSIEGEQQIRLQSRTRMLDRKITTPTVGACAITSLLPVILQEKNEEKEKEDKEEEGGGEGEEGEEEEEEEERINNLRALLSPGLEGRILLWRKQ
ncbi:hypothetical protein HZH66_002244 [Vespula vulgaris]|uniref:Uncharacterized protein n=1 Tax=Vespula vulgaris TaxID=7454 RepID=A0A834KJK8_VESVU|nr:hypothetical protein HZH66_002244 [Vespula vulgaris]